MSWALHYYLNGPIMGVITYLCIFIAAVYITASFIIQIPLINDSSPTWVDWIGLDNFSKDNVDFRENVSGYAITVGVYITALIYRKAAYRHSQKERYMKQRYPERYILNKDGAIKLKDFQKKKKSTLWDSILYNTKVIVKNPYAHLMVFRV